MQHPAPESPRLHLLAARDAKKRCDWPAIAALAPLLPEPLDPAWLPLADEVAFALGRLARYRDAADLWRATFQLAPTWRRASALAYVHYEAALVRRRPRDPDQAFSLEEARDGFRRWVAEALELDPQSVKDLYRLGVFEAQVESAHDKVALRAFLAAITAYRALPAPLRERGDLRKTHAKALYAAGRSALRLGRVKLARRLAFACQRADAPHDHLDPMHRLDLAGRACLANGELDHAERAFRLALDAKGPPRRDHLLVRLSEVAEARGDLPEAIRWLEAHTRPERRAAWIWRRLGDLQRAAGDLEGALSSWHAAIQKDRMGKHLTWTRLADAHAERGELKRAERTYRKAVDFARKRWSKEHAPALRGLAAVLEARGKDEPAERIHARLRKVEPD
ncbi:MAG TPA: hypothetical protein RMH26_15555, partial [Polyangiaceae bacterium LLY-WYZ-15_(1-7)]|nr:hypothetical protein [Polyangiaceae bacterium LLY-WYZ-15_(1-7)]